MCMCTIHNFIDRLIHGKASETTNLGPYMCLYYNRFVNHNVPKIHFFFSIDQLECDKPVSFLSSVRLNYDLTLWYCVFASPNNVFFLFEHFFFPSSPLDLEPNHPKLQHTPVAAGLLPLCANAQ